MENILKKVGVVVLFSLLSLSLFEIKDCILAPTDETTYRVLFSLLLGLVIAFTNGFRFAPKALQNLK